VWSKSKKMREEQQTSKPFTRLRRARIEKGWTLLEASKKVGVSLATYRQWEAGLHKPHRSSLNALCTAFEMTREELGFADLPLDEAVTREKDTHTPQENHSLETLLAHYSQGLAASWQAYMAGAQADLEPLLSLYFARLTEPTLSPGPRQQQAAGLLAQVYQLRALLALQRGDFVTAQQNGTQAEIFSQLARDGNLYIASQLRLASIFTAAKRPGSAFKAYTQALRCAHEQGEIISPLLRSWTHAGVAVLLASMGRDEALASLEAALLFFPETPQEDPSFSYTLCDQSLLLLCEGLIFLRIGHPKEAWETLARIDALSPPPAERVRVEVLRYKASISCLLGNMVQSCVYLEAAARAAHGIQSEWGIGEVYVLYEHMLALWGQEPRVRALARLFQED
jgi:transcriptional regulator with XRE-family HTH domain